MMAQIVYFKEWLIVFYKKHPKNVVINLAIISKNIRKNGCFFVYLVSSTLFEHSFGWMNG